MYLIVFVWNSNWILRKIYAPNLFSGKTIHIIQNCWPKKTNLGSFCVVESTVYEFNEEKTVFRRKNLFCSTCSYWEDAKERKEHIPSFLSHRPIYSFVFKLLLRVWVRRWVFRLLISMIFIKNQKKTSHKRSFYGFSSFITDRFQCWPRHDRWKWSLVVSFSLKIHLNAWVNLYILNQSRCVLCSASLADWWCFIVVINVVVFGFC